MLFPITSLGIPEDEYELESIIQEEGILVLRFISEKHKLTVDYQYGWIIYRSSDEGDRLKTQQEYFCGKKNYAKELMYSVADSEFIEWIIKEDYGMYEKGEVLHHMFVAVNDIVDVLARSMPNVTATEVKNK